MSYPPFENLCKYYLDCLLEDNTENISAFAGSRNPSYCSIGNNDWTNRDPEILSDIEIQNFKTLYNKVIQGRQSVNWWYGFPVSYFFLQSRRTTWQGHIIKPIFYLPVSINQNNEPELRVSSPRINISALSDWDIQIQEARILADDLGIYNDNNQQDLLSLAQNFRNMYPGLPYDLNTPNSSFIKFEGVILSSEGSQYTEGLETELKKLESISQASISNTSLRVFFPELINRNQDKLKNKIEINEAIKLNDEQKKVLLSVFENDLTVVTGPPGTGKSQLVSSIVINAARNNQSVLFASKNHKAIDVVEKRLNQFANRPFIIRLGSMGSDNRDLRQELINYLNTLLGSTASQQTIQNLNNISGIIYSLSKERESIFSKIENFRIHRENLRKLNIDLTESNSEKEIEQLIKWANGKKSFLYKLIYFFSKQKKSAIKFAVESAKLKNEENFEKLCERIDEIENKITENSFEEFKLWIDTLPNRLDAEKRRYLTEYCSVLNSMATAGNNTSKRVWAQLFQNRENLMKYVTGFLSAWCITNLGAKGSIPFVEGMFDILIIDEASQCDIPSVLPLMYRAKRIVVIGDPNQLKHITGMSTGNSLEIMTQYGIVGNDYSVFEFTNNSLYHCAVGRLGSNNLVMLKDHFRSHSDIISFSNIHWYNNEMRVFTDYRRLIKYGNNDSAGIVWINTIGNINQENGSGAFINEEISGVVNELQRLLQINDLNAEIGIVTPFRLQANKIRERLVEAVNQSEWTRLNLLVDTTTKFQGDERDIIIFSPVMAPNMPRGARYFIESTLNLFNVSITRARSKLIVVGNQQECLNCGIPVIQSFARHVQNMAVNNTGDQNQSMIFESPFEKLLYEALLAAGITTIPQYKTDQYRLDLAYINGDLKIDIEVDGVSFHTDWTGELLKEDLLRNLRLQSLGWKVLRFWSYEIRDSLKWCVDEVRKSIRNN